MNYLFITKQQPGMIEEYVNHCISYKEDRELSNGIDGALEPLEDYSDAAQAWMERHRR